MIKNAMTMSEDAFIAMLELLHCTGKHQLPVNPDKGCEAMRKFIRGRDELCEKGWAELDFDGKVCPTAGFARMIYTIPRVISGMCLKTDGNTEWYLRGPIELLHIRKAGREYILTQCGTDELLAWMRDILYTVEKGSITTWCGRCTEELQMTDIPPRTKARADELAKHMCVYYEKEISHA